MQEDLKILIDCIGQSETEQFLKQIAEAIKKNPDLFKKKFKMAKGLI